MRFLLSALILMVIAYLFLRMLKKLWHRLHQIAGIEVGVSQYALPNTAVLPLGYQVNTQINNLPNTFASDKQYQLLQSTHQLSKRQKKRRMTQPSFSILGIEADCIGRMPTQAVIILDQINDKLIRYQDWQQHQSQHSPQATEWLTENKFVINRLISQTIPAAVSQYDQIAKFHPTQLNQPIYEGMTAGEMLTDVLSQVNSQLTSLLDEMFREVSQQFTSTYRYVKTRVEE